MLRKQEIEREKEQKAHNEWFNEARLMVVTKKTCQGERLAWEEGNDSEDFDECPGKNMEVNMVFELP
jgi:hypothetical protein